jgi:hypothetical protein
MSWEELGNHYRERGLVLALGAGVSVGSGLPTWDTLLRRIAQRIVGAEEAANALVDGLRSYGLSLPAIAAVLKEMNQEFKFEGLVRAELYRDFPFKIGITPRNRREFVLHTQQSNATLAAVASLCAVKEAHAGSFERNPRIHAIVNFNLDSVFRTFVAERYGKHLLRSVERASKASELAKISTYYMHGFLRFDLKGEDPSKEGADQMVLTEQEYFDFFNRPTSLFNYTFLYLLREYPCLFVGLSMVDDNIRRLLHYSRIERETAYREEGRVSRAKKGAIRHFAILRSQEDVLDDLIARALSNLGVTVAWVASYEEIPDRLGTVYKASGGKWDEVSLPRPMPAPNPSA